MTGGSVAEATPQAETYLGPEAPKIRGFFNNVGVAALIGLAPASIVYLSFGQGGFFPSTTGFAAIGFAAALVLRTTLAEHPFSGFNRRLAIPLLALAGLGAWQLVSALWSHDTARALDEYDRTLLYLLAMTLFGSLPTSIIRLRWLIRALAAGMTAVCLAALLSRVLPHFWPTGTGNFASRLNYPLTYWNALGLFAAIATILLAHLASSQREHPAVRVLGAALIPATAATALLTFSRGGIAVGVVGIVAYLVLGRPRGFVGAAVSAVPTSAIAVHSAYAANLLATNTPTSPGAVAQGRHVAITVGWCMLAAGALRAVMLIPDHWLAGLVDAPGRWRIPSRTISISAAATALVAVLVLVVSGFAGREYDKFAHPTPPSQGQTRDRLGSIANDNRIPLWKIAFNAFRARPLSGYGAGSYEVLAAQHRPTEGFGSVIHAHSLYLQTLAELGVVGFLLLVMVLLGILGLLAARIRGPDRTVYAVVFAAGLAWAVHAGVDWDWEMPAVTLWLFVAGGAALASTVQRAPKAQAELRNRHPITIGWLVLAVAPLLVGGSYLRLRASGRALATGNCVQARRDALSSISLLAVRPEAYSIISVCDLQLGFPVDGLKAAQKAVHYEKNNWNYRYVLSIALAANGSDPRPTAQQTRRMNPLEPIVQDEVGAFFTNRPRDWESVAPQVLLEGLQSGQLAISTL